MSNFNGNVTSENQISGRMTPSQSLNGRLDARREIVTPANFEDLADVEVNNVQDGQVPKYNAETGKWENKDDAAGDEAVWGNIHGDLTDQTDLIEALSTKQDTLTFDDYPRDLSNNPVTSRGIYQSIQGSDILIDKTVGYVKKNLFHVDSSVVSSSSNGFNTMVYRNSEGEVTEIDLWGTATDPSIETVFDLGAFNVNVGTFILSGGINDDIFLRATRIRSGQEDIVEDKGSGVEFMNSVMLGMFNHAYLVVRNPEISAVRTICPMIRNVEISSNKFYPYTNEPTVKELIENWSNVKKTRVMCASPNIGHYGIGEWQSVLDSPTAQQEAAWGWWQDDAFKLLGGTPGYDVDFDFGYDPSGDVVTLGGYIVDTDTGYLCLKFANYVANPANVRVFVDITIMQNNAPTT